jgi:hypothetical protein
VAAAAAGACVITRRYFHRRSSPRGYSTTTTMMQSGGVGRCMCVLYVRACMGRRVCAGQISAISRYVDTGGMGVYVS